MSATYVASSHYHSDHVTMERCRTSALEVVATAAKRCEVNSANTCTSK